MVISTHASREASVRSLWRARSTCRVPLCWRVIDRIGLERSLVARRHRWGCGGRLRVAHEREHVLDKLFRV